MDMRLIINTGSTSKKYALFRDDVCVLTARFEMVGTGCAVTYTRPEHADIHEEITERVYTDSLKAVFEKSCAFGLVCAWEDIAAIGVRVVAPGTQFTKHQVIDDAYLEALAYMRSFAPLHVTPVLREIKIARDTVSSVPLYAVSDSAFHTTIPEKLWRYSIAYADAETYDIRRFGYHGISMSSVIHTLPAICEGMLPARVIVCHLGGGASITAVHKGMSLDTSMGFSPVSGLHMNTRTGDIDADALAYLAERKGMTFEEVRRYVQREGGLKGVTEGTSDMRDVLEAYTAGSERCALALDMYTTRIKQYIGGYIALLGGLDTLVLTATAAERNPLFRALILKDLEHLGITLDTMKNQVLGDGATGFINKDAGAVGVAVVSTDEMAEMNRHISRMQG